MISHQHKLIFIHIPKCAGRSITGAFNQEFDHYTAAYYQETYPEYWNNYTVFTTVRNPYQRLLSMYHYIKNEPVHANDAITNWGNMLPFKSWIITNMAAYKGTTGFQSAEGNREEDDAIGSTFWFSSQASRLSSAAQSIYSNIHILRYEAGMQAVEDFLHRQTGLQLKIPHLNRSPNNNLDNYLSYYDEELLNVVNNFEPFASDCALLNYAVVSKL